MRICYASDSRVPSRLANSVQVMKMCAAMTRAGHDVRLLATGSNSVDGNAFAAYGIAPDLFPIKLMQRPPVRLLGALLLSLRQKAAVLEGPEPDVVYGRNAYTLWHLRRTGIPLVYEAHAAPVGFRRLAERQLLRSRTLHRIVVISAALRDWYVEVFPEADGRIVVAHDGADPVPRGPGPTVPVLRRHDRPCLGYTGHLYPGKGIETIVQMARRRPGWDFHVLGGRDEDIQAWQSSCSFQNVFFHGHVATALLPWYRQQFDIALLPAREIVTTGGARNIAPYMSPLKLFEYMSSGLPILASDLPVIREVLVNKSTALLVPPNDIDAWIAAAEQLLLDEALRLSLGAEARRDLESKYTWDMRAQRVLDSLFAPARSLQ